MHIQMTKAIAAFAGFVEKNKKHVGRVQIGPGRPSFAISAKFQDRSNSLEPWPARGLQEQARQRRAFERSLGIS